MKRLFITAALCLAPALALAGDHASFHVTFQGQPSLAVIQPGVQVVVDHDEEVFYTGSQYWVHRGGAWYRARHHSQAFAYVEAGHVPAALLSLELGRYRNYRPGGGHGGGHGGGPAGGHGGGHAGGHGGDDGYDDGNYDDDADHGHGGHHGGGHMHGH